MQTNCYLVWDKDKNTIIIDPADEADFIADQINKLGLKPELVILTHGHFDHALAALDLKLMFNIPIAVSFRDKFLLDRTSKTATHFLKQTINIPQIEPDIDLDELKQIKNLKIIKTPGHTPGSLCLYCAKQNLLFSGDTLFKDLRGRTDFSYSSTDDIFKSLCQLMKLPDETQVLPGHGQETKIGNEAKKRRNYCD